MIWIPYHVPKGHIAPQAYRIPQGYIADSGWNPYRCRACGATHYFVVRIRFTSYCRINGAISYPSAA